MLKAYSEKWAKVPVAAKRFIFRALVILVVWKVAYLFFLLPSRVLDKPLSSSLAQSTCWVLNLVTHSTAFNSKNEIGNIYTDSGGTTPAPLVNVYFNKQLLIVIEDGCNGLELFILYAGFIIAMPSALKRKIIFITTGIIAIYIVNVLRCAGVGYIILYHPRFSDFAHHYVFTFVVYGVIIALWLIFSKKLNLVNGQTEQ